MGEGGRGALVARLSDFLESSPYRFESEKPGPMHWHTLLTDCLAALTPIMLHCPDCDREMMAQRADTDPPTAAVARIQCDRCDDGDTHSPEFYDVAGSWVDPVAHLQETCA